MKPARPIQVPNIAAANSTWMNLTARMRSIIAAQGMIRQRRVIASERRRVASRNDELERNLVVHFAAPAAAAARAGSRRDLARRPGRTEIAGVVGAEITATAARTG